MNSNNLKRCPSCGATPKILFTFFEGNFFAACSFCGNRTPYFDSPKKARKAWNNRYTVK